MSTSLCLNQPVNVSRFLLPRILGRENAAMSNNTVNPTQDALNAVERQYKQALNAFNRAVGTAQTARFEIAKAYTTMCAIHGVKQAITDLRHSCEQRFCATWGRKLTKETLDKFVEEYQDLVTNDGFYHGANTVTGQEFALLPFTVEQSEKVRNALKDGSLRVSEVATRVKQAKVSESQAVESVKILMEKLTKLETAKASPLAVQLQAKLDKAIKAEQTARDKVKKLQAELAAANLADIVPKMKDDNAKSEGAKPNATRPRTRKPTEHVNPIVPVEPMQAQAGV